SAASGSTDDAGTVALPPIAVSTCSSCDPLDATAIAIAAPTTATAASAATRSRSPCVSVGGGPTRQRPGWRRPHCRQYSWPPATAVPQRGHANDAAVVLTRSC